MTIELELEINATPTKVWNAFTNVKTMPDWQGGLVKVEEEKGDHDKRAEAAEVFLLHYKIGDQEFSVRETISEAIKPKRFVAVYNHPRLPASISNTNTFQKAGKGTTLWQVSQTVTFTRIDYRLFGRFTQPILRHQLTHDMMLFKQFVES